MAGLRDADAGARQVGFEDGRRGVSRSVGHRPGIQHQGSAATRKSRAVAAPRSARFPREQLSVQVEPLCKSHVLATSQKVYSLSWQPHQTAGQNAHFLHFLARWHPAPLLRHNSWRTNGERKQPHGTDHDRYFRQHRFWRRRASSFSGGTGTEAEFGSLGALSPTWWEPEDGSEPEPWLTPDQPRTLL